MDNNPISDTWNKPETSIVDCHALILGKSNLVMCHTKRSSCPWRVRFDSEKLCLHPSNREIAQGILPRSLPSLAPNTSSPNIC
jgi:hypothetical protein